MAYFGEKVLGNFRKSVSERAKEKATRQTAAQKREGNDPAHLAVLRKCLCVGCLAFFGKNDPHHLIGGLAAKERAVGRRATDRFAVPVCRECHEIAQKAFGARELDLFQSWGIPNVYDYAAALYAAPRDVKTYNAITLAHRQVRGSI
jgi:hypothetical protein